MILGSGFLIAAKKMSPAGYFDGNGDYLTVPSNSALSFGSGNFTIEMWVRPDATQPGVPRIIGNISNGWTTNAWTITSTDFQLYMYNAGFPASPLTPSVVPAPNKWSHVAYVRSGSTLTVYVNGISRGTSTWAGSLDNGTSERLVIGSSGITNTNEFYSGFIDDLRITKGVARYTSNFTVPKDELSLTNDAYAANVSVLLNMRGGDQSTVFVDSSNNLFTISVNGNTKILNILSR